MVARAEAVDDCYMQEDYFFGSPPSDNDVGAALMEEEDEEDALTLTRHSTGEEDGVHKERVYNDATVGMCPHCTELQQPRTALGLLLSDVMGEQFVQRHSSQHLHMLEQQQQQQHEECLCAYGGSSSSGSSSCHLGLSSSISFPQHQPQHNSPPPQGLFFVSASENNNENSSTSMQYSQQEEGRDNTGHAFRSWPSLPTFLRNNQHQHQHPNNDSNCGSSSMYTSFESLSLSRSTSSRRSSGGSNSRSMRKSAPISPWDSSGTTQTTTTTTASGTYNSSSSEVYSILSTSGRMHTSARTDGSSLDSSIRTYQGSSTGSGGYGSGAYVSSGGSSSFALLSASTPGRRSSTPSSFVENNNSNINKPSLMRRFSRQLKRVRTNNGQPFGGSGGSASLQEKMEMKRTTSAPVIFRPKHVHVSSSSSPPPPAEPLRHFKLFRSSAAIATHTHTRGHEYVVSDRRPALLRQMSEHRLPIHPLAS